MADDLPGLRTSHHVALRRRIVLKPFLVDSVLPVRFDPLNQIQPSSMPNPIPDPQVYDSTFGHARPCNIIWAESCRALTSCGPSSALPEPVKAVILATVKSHV